MAPPTTDETTPLPDDKDIPWAWIKATHHILSSHEDDLAVPVTLPVTILPWLRLSDMDSVNNDVVTLKELGITHVLTTNRMPDYQLRNLSSQLNVVGIHHLAVGGLDNDTYDMMGHHWGECLAFLQGVLATNGGQVVVHCAAGVNRSGLIAGAALLVLEGMDVLDVVRLLQAKRGTVLTNPSFQCQLCLLAAQHHRLGPKPEEFTDEWP